VNLSTHYYVLSLSEHKNMLYEAFRDSLIDIRNTWFPFESVKSQVALNDMQLRAHLQTVDHHFAHYYEQDPMGMVLIGTARNRAAFASVTAYPSIIIGNAEGDYLDTSLADLGSIVWPIVKEAMASAGGKLGRDLAAATLDHNVVVGIDAVVQSVDSGVGATLLVEDGYSVEQRAGFPFMENGDNVVDYIIEKVLALGGNVIFVHDGSLSKFKSIALILKRT